MKSRNRTWLLAMIAAVLPAANLQAGENSFSPEDRNYWAYQPLTEPEVPQRAPAYEGWARGPVDRFILAKLELDGIPPASMADRRTLLRRAWFDLAGLPPALAEVEAFEQDRSPNAFARQVDRLLASPRYGERWARHWLDLVRYADSNGYKSDEYRPHAWRYRDYVVNAFNADKPYDAFVTEQLAGDEMKPGEPQALIATGFLRHWPYESNQRDLDQHWEDIINEVTDITADVFLGVSLHCARCHDHKFDPLLQKDYFKLRAFFAGLYPDDDLVAATAEEKEKHARKMEGWLESTAAIRSELAKIEDPALARAEEPAVDKFNEKYQRLLVQPEDSLSPYQRQIRFMADRLLRVEHKNMANKISKEQKEAWKRLRSRLAGFDKVKPRPLPAVMAVREIGVDVPPTHIPGKPDAGEIRPGFLSILGGPGDEPSVGAKTGHASSSGRRSALARWITRGDHPLTTRVMANRLWQYHFGEGLVTNANDFGRQGQPPSHPALLDWLASDFVAHGWSLKHVHRELMLSSVYQQTALRDLPDHVVTSDPDNKHLWRSRIRRLQAEPIRDAMLAVSGELDLAMRGEGEDQGASRRSIYLKVIRNKPEPLADAFDGADGFNSVAHRNTTTTAPQALLLMNGDWIHQRAQALTARVLAATGEEPLAGQVSYVYERVLSRPPSAEECREARTYVENCASVREGIYDLCHLLLNTNEFLYVE